jgi:hypothetical protein
MRYAYLWTPAEYINLDLNIRLSREERRLAAEAKRLIKTVAPIPSLSRRTAELIECLTDLITQVRALPAYNGHAAELLFASLEERARSLRPRFPWWVHAWVADVGRYRLLPHPIDPEPGRPILADHARRITELRRTGRLVLAPGLSGSEAQTRQHSKQSEGSHFPSK